MMIYRSIFALSLFFWSFSLIAQIDFQLKSEYAYSGLFSAYSGAFDTQHPNFLYAASSQMGLVVFEIMDGELAMIKTIPTSDLGGLDVSNLDQKGDELFLALGNFQSGADTDAGIAILDVSDPRDIQIKTVWESGVFTEGSAIIKVQDDYAYLGLMDEGLAIVNISDLSNIHLTAHIIPDINFPSPPGIFSFPHARGLAIQGNYAYICNDAGGLRVIDITDPSSPQEVGKYVNNYIENNAARAYNNILIDGHLAYIAVDYCGVEVVDISNPSAPTTVSLYNPWDCGPSNWEDGQGHASEMIQLKDQGILLIAAGDTELLALDIRDPAQLTEVARFGGDQDSLVAWGIGGQEEQIALFYLNNSGVPDWIPQPYYGDFGGVRLLEWTSDATAIQKPTSFVQATLFPNPAHQYSQLVLNNSREMTLHFNWYNQLGQKIHSTKPQSYSAGQHLIDFDLTNFPAGYYILQLNDGQQQQSWPLIKE